MIVINNTMSTTLEDVQTMIAVDFDSSSTPPATTNTEWARRTKLINRAEKEWARKLHYRWPQLYTETTLTTTPSTATVSLPSDMEMHNIILTGDGYLKVGSTPHKLISVMEKDDYASDETLLWVTGNSAIGYTLNIQPTPSEALSITLRYYSNSLAMDTTATTDKTVMVESSDITKVPDPTYLALYTLAQLFKDDDEGNKGVDFQSQAIDLLNTMIAQFNIGQTNQDSTIGHVDESAGFGGYGRR